MNTKVQEFINRMKKEEQRQRQEKLISLGLVDENKSYIKRTYFKDSTSYIPNAQYDPEKGEFYIETKVSSPIEVTDEEYEEIIKYSTFSRKEVKKRNIETPSATQIIKVANLILITNIIVGIILWIIFSEIRVFEDYSWFPFLVAIGNCIIYYPLVIGLSKIVAVCEIKLQE